MDSFEIIMIGLTTIMLMMSFIIIGCNKRFRQQASTVLFVFTMLATLPLNVYFCSGVLYELSVCRGIFGHVVRILAMPLAYTVFLAVEEIFIGLVGRMVFRKQKSFFV